MKQTGALKAATTLHPLFCFISFIGIYYPLTAIVIIHIFYINESNPYTPLISIFISKSVINFCKPTRPFMIVTPRVEDSIKPLGFRRRILLPCFANAKPLPEAGNIYIGIHPSAHPSAHT